MERKEEKEKRGRERDEFCAVVIFPCFQLPVCNFNFTIFLLTDYSPNEISPGTSPPLGFLQAGCPSCRPTNSTIIIIILFAHKIGYKYVFHMTVHELDKQGY